MAGKPKRKAKKPENVWYEVAVYDWEPTYRFGLNIRSRNSRDDDAFWEYYTITLLGKLVSPELKQARNVRVELAGDPELDDHYTAKPTVISAKAIGFSEIPRGENTLILYCSIPARQLGFVGLAAQAGKIGHASVFGTKLRYRRGKVFSVLLQEFKEDE